MNTAVPRLNALNILEIGCGNLLRFVSSRIRSYRFPLPETIGEYRLVNVIQKENSTPNFYQFGIYERADGVRAYAKQWSGRIKNMEYFWLINEINVYHALGMAIEAHYKELNAAYSHIRIPKLQHVVSERNRLIMMIEYIQGTVLEDFKSPAEGIVIMEQAISYMRDISTYLDMSSRFLVKRGGLYFMLNFYISWLRAAFRFPRRLGAIARAFLGFTQYLPILFTDNRRVLAHRDLTFFNILVTQGIFYIIDFELSVLAHPMFEITQIVTGSWRRQDFRKLWYATKTMKGILTDSREMRAYKALTIYTAIHRLATAPRTEQQLHAEYLDHGLEVRHRAA